MAGPIEPYLKYGVICEQVLAEKDDVLSLIRIVDKFTITIQGRNHLTNSLKVLRL